MPRRKKDPDMPKRPLSSYMFYSKERRPKLQEEKPDLAFGDYSKLIASEWKDMTVEAKEPYLEASKKDKVRYEEQLKEYKEKKRNEPQMHMPVYHPDMDHIHMHKNFTTQDNIDAHHQMRKHYRAFQDPNYQIQYMRHPQHQNFVPGYHYMMQQGDLPRNQQKFSPYYMQNPQYPGSYSYRGGVQQQQQARHAAQFPAHYGNHAVNQDFPKEEGTSRSKNATPSEAQQQRVQFYNQFQPQPSNYQMYSHQQMHQQQAPTSGPPHHVHYQTQFQPHHQHAVAQGIHNDVQSGLPRTEDHPRNTFEDASKLKFGNHDENPQATRVGDPKLVSHGIQELQRVQNEMQAMRQTQNVVQQELTLPQNSKSPGPQTALDMPVPDQKKLNDQKSYESPGVSHFAPPVLAEDGESKVLPEAHLKHQMEPGALTGTAEVGNLNQAGIDSPNLHSIEGQEQNIKV